MCNRNEADDTKFVNQNCIELQLTIQGKNETLNNSQDSLVQEGGYCQHVHRCLVYVFLWPFYLISSCSWEWDLSPFSNDGFSAG